MSTPEQAATIAKLKSNKKLLNAVVTWIVDRGLEKQYKRCSVGLSRDCVKVGHSSAFHGKKCLECIKVYKNEKYRE